MTGFLAGSAIITWILCSALNSFVEFGAVAQWFDRGKAFVAMMLGVLVIAVLMVSVALWGFPESTLAQQHLSAEEINTAKLSSCLLSALVSLGYGGFQLRRFWDER